jgi:hypothetical protein
VTYEEAKGILADALAAWTVPDDSDTDSGYAVRAPSWIDRYSNVGEALAVIRGEREPEK